VPVSGSAARRYAEAILELAPDEPSVAALRTSLERIASALDRSAIAALRDPAIPLATREKALGEAVKEEPVLIQSVLSLLIEHGRIALVPAIAREFGVIVDAREGVANARVTTAVELNDRDRDALVRRLERASGRKVRASFAVDPALIGGAKVQLGDHLVDASLEAQLRALARQLAT